MSLYVVGFISALAVWAPADEGGHSHLFWTCQSLNSWRKLCEDEYHHSCILLECPKLYFKQVKEDQVKQMNIENSFITKWKDTQVSSNS